VTFTFTFSDRKDQHDAAKYRRKAGRKGSYIDPITVKPYGISVVNNRLEKSTCCLATLTVSSPVALDYSQLVAGFMLMANN
jgi:hypothetical protein